LIDDRNRMSLSRFQMLTWMILILSGLLAASLSNIASGQPDPLSIKIPADLWALMGISTTSLVGSPLIKSTKHPRKPDGVEKERTFELLEKKGIDRKELDIKGQIVTYREPKMASISDLFMGEETGNAAHLDLGKVQMFYFTLILALVYAVSLGYMFLTTPIKEFPDLHPSMVWLLGISHGGYLLHKAIPHSRTQ